MRDHKLVLIGSHLGYPMDKTPLGGGAMVALRLARRWAAAGAGLTVLGSGALSPTQGVEYVRLGGAGPEGLVSLSELEYARFCRRFEAQTTDWVLRSGLEPGRAAVVVNDISEGPDLERLKGAGFSLLSLWHVDVVDYFNRLYLGDLVGVERLVGAYERLRAVSGSSWLPDLLKLVFEKQRKTVALSDLMVFPSRAMAATVRRCYALDDERRCAVVPWGVEENGADAAEASARALALRAHYQLGPRSTVLMTLSRISPEKGIHLFLEALARLERAGELPGDVCVFVCGEAAFMRGGAYLRRVRRAAGALRRARVFFPGYLDDAQKQAFYRLAHLFVSPSIHDSYGLNIVEAMQAGLPILASDHYGVRDILDESFGRRVRYPGLSGASGALAAELKSLLADRAALAEMGRRAAERARAMPFSAAADAVLGLAQGLTARGAAAAGA